MKVFKLYVLFILLILTFEFKKEKKDGILNRFIEFIKKYNKNYKSIEEFMARFATFKKNYKKIEEKLKLLKNNRKSYKVGINKFSDLTVQEFKNKYLNLNFDATALSNFTPYKPKLSDDEIPEERDWRKYGRVTPVKDLGSCGASYAFSTIVNLEGLYASHFGTIEPFSEQMIIDCDIYDAGCRGGLIEKTLSWIKENGGIMKEADYPYTGQKETCYEEAARHVNMKVVGYKKIGESSSTFYPVDEELMKKFLYEIGPLSIGFNAETLQSYESGVIDDDEDTCDQSFINHAAGLVGYGHDSNLNLDYWIIKNSWGKDWGEEGYVRIARGKGTCGVNLYVLTALVEYLD